MERYGAKVIALLLLVTGLMVCIIGGVVLYNGWYFSGDPQLSLFFGMGFSFGGLLVLACQLACREILPIAVVIPLLWFELARRPFQKRSTR